MVVPREPHGPGLQGVRRARHGARSARRRHVPRHRPGHGAFRRGARDPRGTGHARVRRRAVAGVLRRRACRGRRGDRPGSRLHRLPLLRGRPSRRTGRDVHRFAQPGAVQRHEALPVGRPPDRARHGPRRHRGRGREALRRTGPAADRRPPRARSAGGVGRPRHLLRRRRVPAPAQGGGRHRQRDGRPGRADRLRPAALRGRDPVPGARRQLPEPSGRPDPAGEPGRLEEGGTRPRRRHRARLRRRRRPGVPRRRERTSRSRARSPPRSSRRRCSPSTPGRRSSTTSSARTSCPRPSPRWAARRCGRGWATPSSRR